MALSGEVCRGSGWAIRQVLEIFSERFNRYYSLKKDRKDELHKLRSDMEALASNNATLREDYGELRRSVASDSAFKRFRGNDGLVRGRGTSQMDANARGLADHLPARWMDGVRMYSSIRSW